VKLSDWTDAPVWEMLVRGRRPPRLTGDPRRWPDLDASWRRSHHHASFDVIRVSAGLQDADLIEPVRRAWDDLWSSRTADDEWTFAHILDAAVDEQDRRLGKPPRPPRAAEAPQ
jgi:hypothetical protein